MNRLAAAGMAALLGMTCPGLHGRDLEATFRNPPPRARPQNWWHWMNGNVSREGITTDLEEMADAGFGGAMIFNLAGPHHHCDTPPGPADYLGAVWLDRMHHAASECERLGLEFGMHNCAGWCTTGGPWITPDLAMQKLVSSEIVVDGGQVLRVELPQPEIVLGHYRDIAVFAIPAGSDTGFRVHQWQPKAGQRGGRAGRQPDLTPLPEGAALPSGKIIDLTGRLDRGGILAWRAPEGRWKIIRLGHTPTGATNKPAPASATGLEIDKLRREGMDVHWKHGIQPVLDHLGPLVGRTFKHVTIDSYEAGLHHWTPRMREEFTKRRGYDPTPYLLALTGRAIGDGPTTDRFLWDFRRTISDLFADNYYGYMAELCHRHGLLFTTEPYTSCFEGLQVGARADIPMGEFWSNGGYSFSLPLASSLAHTNGRQIAAAEAFTAGPEIGRWLNHPGSLRPVGDLAWTKGINRFVLHSYAHQPWADLVPGMTMGQYGCHFGRTNTWWEPGKAWVRYLGRSQTLLQHGEPGTEVLVFAGNAAPNGAAHRRDISQAGYGYDSCGTDTLATLTVDEGDVVLPSGKRYRLLVLPNHGFHTPAFARKLRALVRAGATVLGPKPQHTPSLENFPASDEMVRSIGEEVWGPCDGKNVTSGRFGKGRVFSGMPPAEVLSAINVSPAVQLPPGAAWTHRRASDADIFFISNQSDETMQAVAAFRASGRTPELWNAENGTVRPADGWTTRNRHVHVHLDLAAKKSVFVVFRNAGEANSAPAVRKWSDEPGRTRTLTGPWRVRFQARRGAPSGATFDRLIPWNEHHDPGIRYFSGTATYAIGFDLPAGYLGAKQEVWLDLGDVAVMAEVRLNGTDLGVHWQAPFQVDATKTLRPGRNTLEVAVTNLWVNRLIGDARLPDDCEWTGKALARWPDWLVNGTARPSTKRVTFTTWKHWTPADALLPSGLIGPVTLRAAQLVPTP